MKVICGNNIDVLQTLEECSFDACVTDAPYGLGKEPDPYEMLTAWMNHGYMEVSGGGFMGKEWDSFVPQPNFWKEIYRVLKPGAFVVCFFGTRTYDWGVLAMRFAGFEIKEQLAWLYGEGFPKGVNIGKKCAEDGDTENAEKWKGWRTGLKPAFEPIVLARKPCIRSITENVIEYGTGAFNIEACKIGNEVRYNAPGSKLGVTGITPQNLTEYEGEIVNGRFPTNVFLTHHPDCEFVGTKKVKTGVPNTGSNFSKSTSEINVVTPIKSGQHFGEEIVEVFNCHPDCPIGMVDKQSPADGGASRFFYCTKAKTDEREIGVKMWQKKVSPNNISGGTEMRTVDKKPVPKRANNHPTVKPVELMRYLVRLITPPKGKIIEPFGGSGTTCIAAKLEFMDCVMIELDQYNCDVAEARLKKWAAQHSVDDFFKV